MWEMILKDLTIVSWVGIAGLFSVVNMFFSLVVMLFPFVAVELIRYGFYARKARKAGLTGQINPKPSALSLSSIPALFKKTFTPEEYVRSIAEPVKREALLKVMTYVNRLKLAIRSAPERYPDEPFQFIMLQVDHQLKAVKMDHTAEAAVFRTRIAKNLKGVL